MESSKIESGVQLFSRLKQRKTIQNIHPTLFLNGPFPNEIIEITGGSSSGKTLFVTDLLAKCVLPSLYKGKQCGAVLISTEHHFDLLKLVQVMETLIKESSEKLEGGIEHIIKSSLNNLIILNCYDSHQLLLTFLNLEKILSEDLNIGLVILDSLSANYWEYRLSKGIISYQNYYTKVLESLKCCVKNSNVVTVFTRAEIEQPSEKDISLNESYKISLKQNENGYVAVVTNNTSNISRTLLYMIDNTIKFIP